MLTAQKPPARESFGPESATVRTSGPGLIPQATDSAKDAGQSLIDYYSQAGPDYAAWSKDFNMHFGYLDLGRGLRSGVRGLFDRESMLREMNRQVIKRLKITPGECYRLLDAGCGLGTVSRHAASLHPEVQALGITLVPWQVEQAHRLTAGTPVAERVEFIQADYTNSGLRAGSFDGVMAVESACYAPGPAKLEFLQESRRLLRPGGRIVIADGFRTSDRFSNGNLGGLLGRAYHSTCRSWEIEQFAQLGEFTHALGTAGFRNVQVEDISWKVAPSFAHVPFVTWKFLRSMRRQGTQLSAKRRQNYRAPLLALLLGAARRHFSYCLVTATADGSREGR